MSSYSNIFSNVFTNDEIEYLNSLPEVLSAKEKLSIQKRKNVYFSITLTPSIRDTLQSRLGLDLSNVSEIPMRWIQGDTAPHIDVGSTVFDNTYLVYVNDSQGEFVLDESVYPISGNTAFVFNEGLLHKTQNTGSLPRLLYGVYANGLLTETCSINFLTNHSNLVINN
jgi:hypothetical protein